MSAHFGGRQRTYAGPWQIYGRDIDPTLPPPRLRRNEHDDNEVGPTFPSDEEVWWNSPGPSYEPGDPPVDNGWAVDTGDLPEFEPMVRRKDERGTGWVVLHAYHDWKDQIPEGEESSARRRRELWSHVYSWLVRPGDQDALVAHLERRSLMGRWMPTGSDHTDAAYLGEAPWAAAAKEEEPYPDREIETSDGERAKRIDVRPGWEAYLWEGNVLDCSIEDSVEAEMPDRVLYDAGELTWIPGTRTWRGPDGSPSAQYRDRDRHSALLVRESWLKRTLRKCGYSMVFGWLGENGWSRPARGDWLATGWRSMRLRLSQAADGRLAGGDWTAGAELTRRSRRETLESLVDYLCSSTIDYAPKVLRSSASSPGKG